MTLLKLFIEFLMIGAFTFGGGYAMLPLIAQVAYDNEWLSPEQLIDFVAVSESTPGPFAVNISTYIGIRTAGIPGALMATLGVVLPSFIIILIVSCCYEKFKESRAVKAMMSGIQPAVVALIATAVLSVAKNVFDINNIISMHNLQYAVIMAVAGLLAYKKVHPVIIICVSAIMGIVLVFIC